ncbi:MAG: LON peptidase substrate-binding domain-containing protein [Opitutaceae bacterium]|nr:LON peptidase substrate-binding domain-containing protein [Opitutaceae bacterium]
MEMEIVVPNELAVMTLPEVAFFPQALLPLHIFEPRYCLMLKEILASHRLFAVAGLNASEASNAFEPAHRIATVGIIRACQKNENGTSNLLLQGLARIEVQSVVREEPYRKIKVRALTSRSGAPEEENLRLRASLARLLSLKQRLSGDASTDFSKFLKTIDDPEIFVDVAAFNLCDDAPFKQRLLETLNVHERLQLFAERLRREIGDIRLRRKLQGGLSDDAISNN